MKHIVNSNACISALHSVGTGLRSTLMHTVLTDATREGYQQILLDTFPFLTGAIMLYRKLGFYEVPSYNGSPMKELIYIARDLP